MDFIDVMTPAGPCLGLADSDALYSFGSMPDFVECRYGWQGKRTSKTGVMSVWVNGHGQFLQLLAYWNQTNTSFRFFEEVR
jgi:hypothetical protein